MKTNEKELQDLGRWSREGMILHFITATGILRSSFSSDRARKRYKNASIRVITRLLDKVDDNSLTNRDIRREILKLSDKTKCSVGLAQKGINVVLKYYCFAIKANPKLLKELDCPIDNRIMRYFYKAGCYRPEYRLLKLSWKNYMFLQDVIERKEGLRILGEWVYEDEYQDNALG